MKNENDFETLLKTKMDELSDSVSCFDKISEKAFPKSQKSFFEGGYVISDVENVTGKNHFGSVWRWCAALTAAVICISIIPHTAFFNRIMTELNGTEVSDTFVNLTNKIAYETENYEYEVFDIPLDYYIRNDILITPMFPCPFGYTNGEETNVRIFIKDINGLPTNQIYAVEYCGSYTEDNFIAAASSGVEITKEDIETFPLYMFETSDPIARQTILNNFKDSEYNLTDSENSAVIPVSFFNQALYKINDELLGFQTEVFYGIGENGKFYDIIAYSGNYSDNNQVVISERFTWDTSIFMNGISAFPKENHSEYKKKMLFDINSQQDSDSKAVCLQPFKCEEYESFNELSDISYDKTFEIKIDSGIALQTIGEINLPISSESKINMSLYFSAFRIYNSVSDFTDQTENKIVLNGKKFGADKLTFSNAYARYLEEYYDLKTVAVNTPDKKNPQGWSVEELREITDTSKRIENK